MRVARREPMINVNQIRLLFNPFFSSFLFLLFFTQLIPYSFVDKILNLFIGGYYGNLFISFYH